MQQSETRAVDVDLNSVVVLGQHIARSGMLGVETEYQGTMVAFECYKRNLTPLEFGRVFHIMHGKPSMRADAMLAEYCRQGHGYEIVEIGPAKVHLRGNRKGKDLRDWSLTIEEAEALELPFQPKRGGGYVVDAQGNKVYKDNWRKQPKNMLFARVVSDMIRKTAPEIVAGIYTPEEVSDFDDAPVKVSPPAPAAAPQAPAPQPAPQPAPEANTAPAAQAPANPDVEPAELRLPADLPNVGGKLIAELNPAQVKYFHENGAKFNWWNDKFATAFAEAVA